MNGQILKRCLSVGAFILAGAIAVTAPVIAGEASRPHGPPWFASGGHHGFGPAMHGGMMGGRAHQIMRHLDRTREQKSAIGKITDKTRPVIRETMLELAEARQQINDIINGDNFDEAAVRKIANANGAKIAELVELTARSQREIRSVLTPDQLEKLERLKDRAGRRSRPFSNTDPFDAGDFLTPDLSYQIDIEPPWLGAG